MRVLHPNLNAKLRKHCRDRDVGHAPPLPVSRYTDLVQHAASLAYANPDQLLFFRGQDRDYQSKAGGSTMYPTIYRGDQLDQRELRYRFDLLEQAARTLAELVSREGLDGHQDVCRRLYIRWSILQHYQVVPTPLLDITHSIRVACSFAQLASTDTECHVFVFGLPYLTNRISINSEVDIVNVRLLSICPPEAFRPYFQEGYLVGTPDVTAEFASKTELDLCHRLIAKFSIPSDQTFWSDGFGAIPEHALYPDGDLMCSLCEDVKKRLANSDLNRFLEAWRAIEDCVQGWSRAITARNSTLLEAMATATTHGFLPGEAAAELQEIGLVRRQLLDDPRALSPSGIAAVLARTQFLSKKYLTACADCGTDTTVPFRPKTGHPVYCRDCYDKRRPRY